jgi:hypothetical protein
MSEVPPSMSAPLRERWIAAQDQIRTALENPHLLELGQTAASASQQNRVNFNRARITRMTDALNAIDQAVNPCRPSEGRGRDQLPAFRDSSSNR